MPKYKIGIIKRQVIEKRWEVEIEAPTLTQAAENAEKAVDAGLMGDGDEELIDTTTERGTWDDDGEWIKLCN